MKLDEIRNKMFGLSDLKGLIKENMTDEAFGAWDRFFLAHPEYLESAYEGMSRAQFLADRQLRKDIADFEKNSETGLGSLGGAYAKYIGPDSNLDGISQNDFLKQVYGKGFVKKRLEALGRREKFKRGGNSKLPDRNVALNDLIDNTAEITDSPSTITSLDLLRNFFNERGKELIFPGIEETTDWPMNYEVLIPYFEGVKNLSDEANMYFTENRMSVDNFNASGLNVGDVKEPFLLFLFFYFVQYCGQKIVVGSKAQNVKEGRVNAYLENVAAGFPREYVKQMLGLKPNIFDIVNRSANDLVASSLKSNGYTGSELMNLRSFLYYDKYKREFPNENLSLENVEYIAGIFQVGPSFLFDPLSTMSEAEVGVGLGLLLKKQNTSGVMDPVQTLNFLARPTLVTNTEDGAPIEKIFTLTKIVISLLNTDFAAKFGKSGENVLGPNIPVGKKVTLFLSPANVGVEELEKDARGRRKEMPKHIATLKTECDSRLKEKDGLKFWELLNKDSSDMKTQDEVRAFLVASSDPDVVWEDKDYNRYKRADMEKGPDGLGSKSIDILGRKTNGESETILCFEYQGEQHAHPACLKQTDYDYPLFTAMYDEILTKCGFTPLEEDTKIKYYAGHENINEKVVEEVIISVYEEFASLLEEEMRKKNISPADIITTRFSVKPPQQSIVTEASKLGRRLNAELLPEYKIEQAAEYFRWVCTEGIDDPNLFEPASLLNGVVPYLCSAVRFKDEVLCAMGRQRDIVKNEIIRKRRELGWEMAYVVPSLSTKFTEDDLKYTVSHVTNGCKVFQWNKEGKLGMIDYLQEKGFRTIAEGQKQKGMSLFEDIVNELLKSDSLVLPE